jgi:hypothetical protein
MWVLKQWKKSKCLEQLQMSDTRGSQEDTFLYKLSTMKVTIDILSSHRDWTGSRMCVFSVVSKIAMLPMNLQEFS